MIVRKKLTRNFSVMPNAVFTDERLSIGARWCLGYLLSKPDHWEVKPGDISRAGGIGREKGQQLVRELIDAGWIIREEVYEGNIKQGYHYVVLDEPVADAGNHRETEIPSSGRETGSRETGFPSLSKELTVAKTDNNRDARARKEAPASATENRNPSHSNAVNTQTGTVVPLPKKGTRLAEDFEPSPASRAKAVELGLDPATFERELEKFRNYWLSKAGKDATKIDWQRTLQNWLITAAERNPTNASRASGSANGSQRPEPPGSNLDRIFAKINSAIAAGGAGGG